MAMSPMISLSISNLRSQASHLGQEIQNAESSKHRLKNLRAELDGEWQANTGDKQQFLTEFDENNNALESLIQDLFKLQDILRSVADELEAEAQS